MASRSIAAPTRSTARASSLPTEVVVLNEAESSLHVDLLPALAELVAVAMDRCQIVVVTHAADLLEPLRKLVSPREHQLELRGGATTVISA